MTAQIPDVLMYREALHTVVCEEGVGLYNPWDYGVEAFMTSTANCRGFQCTYALDEDSLVLRELRIATFPANIEKLPGLERARPNEKEEHGMMVYTGLAQSVPFSGG